MIYLACNFTHPLELVRDLRNQMITSIAADLICANQHVFSPITYGNAMNDYRSVDDQLPHDYRFWRSFCLAMLNKSDSMIAVHFEGWEHSEGLRDEKKMARKWGIPFYCKPIEEYAPMLEPSLITSHNRLYANYENRKNA